MPDQVQRSHLECPDELRVEKEKVVGYLLNAAHPVGKSKEKLFSLLGFTPGAWTAFADALRQHAHLNPIDKTEAHGFGTKYVVDCNIPNPNNKEVCVRVVWNDHCDGNPPRLVTAHPLTAQ